MLSRVEYIRNHPIRELFDNGIKVTVNTDDVIVFQNGVSEEFLLCKYKSGKPKIIDKNEIEKIFWMSKEEIIKDKYSLSYLKESVIKAEKVILEVT